MLETLMVIAVIAQSGATFHTRVETGANAMAYSSADLARALAPRMNGEVRAWEGQPLTERDVLISVLVGGDGALDLSAAAGGKRLLLRRKLPVNHGPPESQAHGMALLIAESLATVLPEGVRVFPAQETTPPPPSEPDVMASAPAVQAVVPAPAASHRVKLGLTVGTRVLLPDAALQAGGAASAELWGERWGGMAQLAYFGAARERARDVALSLDDLEASLGGGAAWPTSVVTTSLTLGPVLRRSSLRADGEDLSRSRHTALALGMLGRLTVGKRWRLTPTSSVGADLVAQLTRYFGFERFIVDGAVVRETGHTAAYIGAGINLELE